MDKGYRCLGLGSSVSIKTSSSKPSPKANPSAAVLKDYPDLQRKPAKPEPTKPAAAKVGDGQGGGEGEKPKADITRMDMMTLMEYSREGNITDDEFEARGHARWKRKIKPKDPNEDPTGTDPLLESDRITWTKRLLIGQKTTFMSLQGHAVGGCSLR
jgi:hypothetical protein